jgi:hypothetical protein
MSVGSHSIDIDDVPARYDDLQLVFRRHPFIADTIDHLLDTAVVNCNFDMPFTAGYSRDWPPRYYIDRHVPEMVRLPMRNGIKRLFRISRFLLCHEVTEVVLQRKLSMPHERAHHLATAAEYHEVKLKYVSLFAYRVWAAKWVKADEIRAGRNPRLRIPADFDTTPIEADRSAKGRMLLVRVREAMQ